MRPTFDLLALDVDGTLLDERHQVSPGLRTELDRARELGVRLCLCTGRPYAAIMPLLHDLQISTQPVVFNGALVPYLDDSEPLVSKPLHPRAVQQLIEIAHLTGFYLELHTATHCHVERMGFEGEWQMQKLGIEPIV
jgi:HAD superfamily hydrolase (TIGR01484 family)